MRRTARACKLSREELVVGSANMARRSASSFAIAAALVLVICLFCFAVQADASLASASSDQHAKKQHLHRLPTFVNSEEFDGPGPDTPFEWTGKTVAGVIAAILCALLANAAGIGGGPFYIPLFNSLLGFDLKLCTGLSHTVVASGAVGSTIYGLIQPSPSNPSATLLNADIALQFVPAMLFGVGVGVLFNPLCPEWLQTALLTVLLLVVVRKTFQKGFRQWSEEQKSVEKARAAEEPSVETPLVDQDGDGQGPAAAVRKWGRSVSIMLDHAGTDEHFSAAHIEEKAESLIHRVEEGAVHVLHRLPLGKLAILVLLWAVFLITQMEKAKYGRCSWQFAAILAFQTVMLAGVTLAALQYESHKFKHSPDTMDVEMRKIMSYGSGDGSSADGNAAAKKLLQVVAVVAAAGFVAGLLGIGGALIFNPFLLQLGVHPQVVASTAVMIILFGSSSISLSFYFNGLLNTSYAKVFGPIAFVSSLLGVTVIGYLVRRSGRASIIIILMACIIAAGTLSTVVFGGLRSYEDIKHGHDIGFKSFC